MQRTQCPGACSTRVPGRSVGGCGQRGQRLTPIGGERWHRPQQALGVGVPGTEKNLVTRSGLEQHPLAHHRHPVGNLRHHRQVMGNEKHAQPVALLQRFEQTQNLRLHGNVERSGGLVGDQQERPVYQSHGDQQPLSLAARKLVGIVAQALLRFGDRHRRHRLHHGIAYLRPAHLRLMGFDGFGYLPPYRHNWVESRHGLLKDHGDLPSAIVAHLLRLQGQQVRALEADRAFHSRHPIQ